MKTIISVVKLSFLVLCCQFLIAESAENTISKEVYVSFEDKQAALGDKDFYNFNIFSKISLIIFMIIGRIELLSIIILFKKFLFKN